MFGGHMLAAKARPDESRGTVAHSPLWGLGAGRGQGGSPLPSSRFSELVDGWLFQLGATKPAANTLAGYRRTWRVWPSASPPMPRWLCCTSST